MSWRTCFFIHFASNALFCGVMFGYFIKWLGISRERVFDAPVMTCLMLFALITWILCKRLAEWAADVWCDE